MACESHGKEAGISQSEIPLDRNCCPLFLLHQEEPLDESSVKKMILTFEKRSYKNQELRIKFPDNPEKYGSVLVTPFFLLRVVCFSFLLPAWLFVICARCPRAHVWEVTGQTLRAPGPWYWRARSGTSSKERHTRQCGECTCRLPMFSLQAGYVQTCLFLPAVKGISLCALLLSREVRLRLRVQDIYCEQGTEGFVNNDSKPYAPRREADIQCSGWTKHPYHLGNLSKAKFPDTSPGLDSSKE